jgi:hypothetical protein
MAISELNLTYQNRGLLPDSHKRQLSMEAVQIRMPQSRLASMPLSSRKLLLVSTIVTSSGEHEPQNRGALFIVSTPRRIFITAVALVYLMFTSRSRTFSQI